MTFTWKRFWSALFLAAIFLPLGAVAGIVAAQHYFPEGLLG